LHKTDSFHLHKTFLCRTPKGEDLRRAIPSALVKTKTQSIMEYSANSSSLRNGAESRRQRCRCYEGGCGQPESTRDTDNLQRILQRHQAALTEFGGGPSRYEPPPPYSGPAPLLDAPPPPLHFFLIDIILNIFIFQIYNMYFN
ncbi:hypothetical protein SFRURICE_016909, partial [Spodoptera frugiperda]